jgi:poly(A) polymerase
METTFEWGGRSLNVQPEWLQGKLRGLMAVLNDAGFEAYAVGGCVRDAVLGVPCNDVDVATNATPPVVKGTLQAAGYKLYPTGVEHGTWTVGLDDEMFEVTTYRRDVATDGRRATVEFANTMKEDSERRDFTMNALYMDKDGNVLDPTEEGIADLLAGRVRFVGDANERCAEDYLRILRLFRFHAKYGTGPMDVEAWSAASRNAFGLMPNVSGERIWDELRKILSLHSPFEAVLEMEATQVLYALFQKRAFGTAQFANLMRAERQQNFAPNWPRRYFALFGADVPFPCSKAETKYLQSLKVMMGLEHTDAVLVNMYDEQLARDRSLLLGKTKRFPKEEAVRGFHAKLPVTSADFMERGVEEGPKLGQAMRSATAAWHASDMKWDREMLLDTVVGA